MLRWVSKQVVLREPTKLTGKKKSGSPVKEEGRGAKVKLEN